jgi:hypothetical protein
MIVDRSMEIKVSFWYLEAVPDRVLNILVRLTQEGFLKNNRRLIVSELDEFFQSRFLSRMVDATCSMENLETLDLRNCKLTLEQLPRVFSSCPKLQNLYLNPLTCVNWEIDDQLKNGLRRSGFQRLKIFKFKCKIDNNSWRLIQEMLT